MSLTRTAHFPASIIRLVKMILPRIVHFPASILRLVKITVPRLTFLELTLPARSHQRWLLAGKASF